MIAWLIVQVSAAINLDSYLFDDVRECQNRVSISKIDLLKIQLPTNLKVAAIEYYIKGSLIGFKAV